MSHEVSFIQSHESSYHDMMLTMLLLQSQEDRLVIQLEESKALEASLQEKIVNEKQKYSDLLRKYEELQSSLSLGREVETELTKLQLTMEEISISLEKMDATKNYWGDKVCKATANDTYNNVTRPVK